MTPSTPLPLVLAGPVLRRLEPQRLAIWLVATQPLQPDFICPAGEAQVDCQVLPVGQQASFTCWISTSQIPCPATSCLTTI